MHQRNTRSQESFSLILNTTFQNTVYTKTNDAFPKIQAWAYNRYSSLHRSRLRKYQGPQYATTADNHENVAWRVNSHFFSLYRDYSNSLTLSNASELFWSWTSISRIQVFPASRGLSRRGKNERKERGLSPFSHFLSLYKKRDARAKLLFCLVKLFLFLLSRRRFILNFLLYTIHCDPSETEFSRCKLNCSCW